MCNVNVTTGELIRHEVDVYYPGFIPIEFIRIYRNTSSDAGWLGQGWINNFDISLKWDGERVVYHGENARDTILNLVNETGMFESEDRSVMLYRQSDFLVLEKGDKLRYFFTTKSDAIGLSRIVAIRDVSDNSVQFTYTKNGLLDTIIDTLGRRIRFQFDRENRITQVSLVEDPALGRFLTKIKYSYDSNNNLYNIALA